MSLAVSNIAWPAGLDRVVYPMLLARGIRLLEVAPTRVWPQWQGITPDSGREFRRAVEAEGLRISSLQSLLFQKPELRLFGSAADRAALCDHLRACADLAVELGADCLVFGSPKNRDRGELTEEQALLRAADVFARVGACCEERGVCLVFEANPAAYGCNFATDSATAARLVHSVGSPGFRLHLDTACLYLSSEPPAVIAAHVAILRHVHVSEPGLGTFFAPQVDHRAMAAELESAGYGRSVALEMGAVEPVLPALEEAVRFLVQTYDAA